VIYEYSCPEKHITVRWRKMAERHDPVECESCKEPASLIISKTHRQPDGIYSYCPNVGSEEAFVRKRDAIARGDKVIEKFGS
jgi:hypothetical protein